MKIDVKDFNLYYGDFHALKNINIGMPEHEVSALIGPSGCGKSTLLKSLNRMNDLVPGVKITGRAALDGVRERMAAALAEVRGQARPNRN